MTLRCKPGDLAVIVRSAIPSNVGRLVEVLGHHAGKGVGWWHVRVLGTAFNADGRPVSEGLARDTRLRPLRDQDGTDEVLRIAQRTA